MLIDETLALTFFDDFQQHFLKSHLREFKSTFQRFWLGKRRSVLGDEAAAGAAEPRNLELARVRDRCRDQLRAEHALNFSAQKDAS